MDIKKIKKIVSFIFLGALGSGLWSVAGELTAGFIYEALLSIGGNFATSFGNFMNGGIGYGGWEDRGSMFFMLLFLWVFFLFSAHKIFALNNEYLRYTAIIVIFLFSSIFSYKTMYSHKLTLYFNKNIEILAPNISDIETKKARSMYRLINNLETFYNAQDYILKLAKNNGSDINKF